MSIFDDFRDWLLAPLMGDEWVENRKDIIVRRGYGRGKQKQPLKSKSDSLIINFTGLVLARGIALLFGKGVTFDLPNVDKEDSPEQEYIDTVWRLNKKGVLLHNIGRYGGEAGTWYLKIIPDALEDLDGKKYPRLVTQDPARMTIATLPEDCETVVAYTIAYNLIDPITEKEIAYKQVTEQDIMVEGVFAYWSIRDYKADSGGKWILQQEQPWEHSYPPIQHGQNLPQSGTPYGEPDVTDDLMAMQDYLNFTVSNIGKIIKHHASPKTWGRLFGKSKQVKWGIDDMVLSDNPEAFLSNLEMESDLISSNAFVMFLRQAIFDISRQVDLSSINDRLGALTNFALRVLYQDALAKNDTKQMMYGEALVELNGRLLDLANAKNLDAGKAVWPFALPMNTREQAETLTIDRADGRVSKQTATIEQGRDWEQEQERLAEEKTAASNIGASIIDSFNRTGGDVTQ